MMLPAASLTALAAIAALAAGGWLVSLRTSDVSHVDSLWSLFFLLAASIYAIADESLAPAGLLALLLVAIWAIRLSLHIAERNHGKGEDSRYRAMREKRGPGFRYRSLYLVFGLQAVLAWLLSAPLYFAITAGAAIGGMEMAAALLWLVGFVFEAGGDWQLRRFLRERDNERAVLDRGLWRYTRHPNYFGEACMWWAYWLLAAAAGAWWTVFAPVLMTWLLLRVSGVALLEKSIGERRPEYRDYVERTSAFLPLPPRERHTKEGTT